MENKIRNCLFTIRHVSSCERWLSALGLGRFRNSKGQVSTYEKACFAMKNVKYGIRKRSFTH